MSTYQLFGVCLSRGFITLRSKCVKWFMVYLLTPQLQFSWIGIDLLHPTLNTSKKSIYKIPVLFCLYYLKLERVVLQP